MESFYECDPNTEISTGENPEFNLPEGIPPLRSFYLYLSDSCNLRCRHCWITPTYIEGKPTPGEVINILQLKAAVTEGKTLGLVNAKLTGGEPMLHPEFKEIATMLSEESLNMNMETNGTLIDREIARFLKNDTKINFISISLDSANEKYHDSFRGSKGAYRAALNGLKYLVDAGYENVQIIMSPHRKNVSEVKELAELAEANGAASLKLNPITNNGRGMQMHENDETLSIKEVLELADLARGELKQTVNIPILLHVPPAIKPLTEFTSTGGSCGDCRVDHILGILGSGDVALCGIGRTIPEFVYGNIATDSIRYIWLNHPKVVGLRDALCNFDNYPELCRNCVFIRKCRTGCVVQNYSDFGKLIWSSGICQYAEEYGLFKDSRKKVSP